MSSVSSAEIQVMCKNIAQINKLDGYDVVIVCTSNETQAHYWERRLESVLGQIIPRHTKVLAVNEDWDGGAGNGLGTLYAYQKACTAAKQKYDFDMHEKLSKNEVSVALYHTAGKGTRLAPLPGAENNNKPGVKLPASIQINGVSAPLTILEAVIKQTGAYAQSRKGRLSVYWGDQVFIPTVPTSYKPSHHVDILCKLGPMPDANTWAANGLEKYGLIAVNESGNAAQVEKVSHADALALLDNLGTVKDVGVSLGSFSVSSDMLKILLNCFAVELKAKKGKYDTDPHMWMPFTLTKEAYVTLMKKKNEPENETIKHYERMQECKRALPANSKIFGAVDVGVNSYWWDYGQLKLYYGNNMRITESGQEASMYREFLGLPKENGSVMESFLDKTMIKSDTLSVISFSSLEKADITKSVINNACCRSLVSDTSILVNVTANSIKTGKNCLIYNVLDDSEEGLVLADNEVLVGIFDGDGKQRLIRSTLAYDGGKYWKEAITKDQPSFETIYKENLSADVNEIEQIMMKKHHTEIKRLKKLNKNGKLVGSTTNWKRYAAAAGIAAIAGVGGTAYYLRTRKLNA